MATAFGVVAAVAFGAATPAEAGIKSTKHNLGSTGTGTNKKDGSTTEICVFCHTPHGSNTGLKAPLWNKPAQTDTVAGAYSTYDSASLDSKPDEDATAGITKESVSYACLSCHDGTQAMDAVLNNPGSGNVAMGGTWQGGGQTNGKLTSVANLGRDLSNDHPVGMVYANYGGTAMDDTIVAAVEVSGRYFVDVDNWYTAMTGTAVGNGTAGTLEKTDMVLYTRSDNKPYVECASCHDPHSSNELFLRIPNRESQVCLACHDK